jgi:hypothetical protein
MRLWALTDDAVLASVQRSDGRVLRAVQRAFADCGSGPRTAAAVACGVRGGRRAPARVGPDPAAPSELRDRFLDLMLRP